MHPAPLLGRRKICWPTYLGRRTRAFKLLRAHSVHRRHQFKGRWTTGASRVFPVRV